MAVAALTQNKLRAVLTTLGVVIGISTVLLMGWFLSGLDSALEKTLSIFGDDVLYVDKWDWTGGTWIESRNRQPSRGSAPHNMSCRRRSGTRGR